MFSVCDNVFKHQIRQLWNSHNFHGSVKRLHHGDLCPLDDIQIMGGKNEKTMMGVF